MTLPWKKVDNPKSENNTYLFYIRKKTQHRELPNAKNKRCKVCDIIIDGNPGAKFKINKNLKNLVYIIECNEYKEIYIGLTQALNTMTSLHKSNIKKDENRKLNVSKYLYLCSSGKFNTKPIYQNNDYTLLQIKERNFMDKFKPKLNKTWTIHTQTKINIHTHTHTRIYIYVCVCVCTLTQNISN